MKKEIDNKCNICLKIEMTHEEYYKHEHIYIKENPMTNPPLNTKKVKAPQLDREIEKTINGTFSHLAKKKKASENYCVHDVMDNCFDSIEDFRKAVTSIVLDAQATTKQELVQEIEKMDVKENQPSYWIEIFKPSQLGIALDGLESFKRKVLEVLQKEKE